MTTIRRRLDLIDLIRELTEQHQHRQFYMRKKKPRYHTTNNPPLLDQLADAIEPKSSVEAGTARPATSRPSAALDAIDTAIRIDTDAARWLRHLGQDDPGNTLECVRQLGALAVSTDHCGRAKPHGNCCTYHRIESDVRRWWSWARIVTRWDLPAWQPDNTCPLCGTRGTLRVRVTEKLATCIDDTCRETWDDTTIGLLADHIRAENHDTQVAS